MPIGKEQRLIHYLGNNIATAPVSNKTFINRSTIEWVKGASMSTVKFQSSFLLHIFSVISRTMPWKVESHHWWIIYTLTHNILCDKTLIYWNLRKHWALRPLEPIVKLGFTSFNNRLLGPQNSMFPSVTVNKWLILLATMNNVGTTTMLITDLSINTLTSTALRWKCNAKAPGVAFLYGM